MKSETAKYIRSQSAPEVLASKPGEFVQPVGPGFSVGGPDNQWDDVDVWEVQLPKTKLKQDNFSHCKHHFFMNEPIPSSQIKLVHHIPVYPEDYTAKSKKEIIYL